MKIKVKIPVMYLPLEAVFIISIAMIGSQMQQQIIAQDQPQQLQTNNASSSASSPPSSVLSIPVSKGFVNGKIAFFIATDASDNQTASSITNTTGFKVNVAPNLALTPESSRQQGYVFVNGIKMSGSPMGFQLGISSALPGEKGYSPLYQVNFVKWNANASPKIIQSVAELMTAEMNGELTISKTNIVINSPAIMLSR